jgi:Kef-type K+ transport system membrane component KefB
MTEHLLLNLIIVFIGIAIIPYIASKIGMPVIVLEIVFGIIIGKSLLNMLPEHSTIEFFASFGLVYLMFLAGLEIDFKTVSRRVSDTVGIASASFIGAFAVGAVISSAFGVHPLLLGAILSTTSLGLILPLAKDIGTTSTAMTVLQGSVVLVDILSIFALALSLAVLQGNLQISFVYSIAAVLVLFIIPWLMNRFDLSEKVGKWLEEESHFEMEVRLSFALIILLGSLTGELGFHLIMGAFIAGLIISEITPDASMLEKHLNTFGYGFFIPLFFIFTGANVDLQEVFLNLGNLGQLGLLVGAGILSKVVGVYIAAKSTGCNNLHSLSFGFFHTARLSLIIAAAQIGLNEGFISSNLFSMLVVFALITAVIGPFVGVRLYKLSAEKQQTDAAAESS